MAQRFLLASATLLAFAGAATADDRPAARLAKIDAKSADRRAAWDDLVKAGPDALLPILEAMDTPDTVTANWLRTAFDRVVDDELKKGGKGIDADKLLAFAKDARRRGRARRLALEVIDRIRPGAADALSRGWLDDPEFRFDAVALGLREADAAKDRDPVTYRKLFAASRDIHQVKALAACLRALGESVRVTDHLGFLGDWYAIGPFDADNMKGFKTAYPPEHKVDLTAQYDGKGRKVAWKRLTVAEPPPAGFNEKGLVVSLPAALGDAEDAVAYAYTEFRIPAAVEAEFRGAADDNFTVWVNGRKAFAFEEYRNGVRLDRHRFRAKLDAGVNRVLVKVCQAPNDPTTNEPNWEFVLRAVDDTGKGLALTPALPKKD